MFVVPITEVDGGDRLKFDHWVFTGLGCGWMCGLNLWDTKLASLDSLSSDDNLRFLAPDPDWAKIWSISSSLSELDCSFVKLSSSLPVPFDAEK